MLTTITDMATEHHTFSKTFIGEIIKNKVDESGMNYAEFARKLNCSRTTVYNIFKKKSLDIDMLMTISKILDYDFLAEVYGLYHNPTNNDVLIDKLTEKIRDLLKKTYMRKEIV